MRSLYRMSRTAGVGLQDYAAVNVLAVIGVLLAVASVLVLIFADAPAMLVIPAAAIITSIIAFIQIQRSNGTQTGRGIALAGVVIALGLAGTNVFGRVSDASRNAADRQAITALLKQFQAAATTGKGSDAYALFDTRFHEVIQPETFDRTLSAQMQRIFGGMPVKEFDLGERVQFETDANGVRFATALMIIKCEKTAPSGVPYQSEEPAEFRKVDDQWKFRGIPNWYAATPQKGGGQAPPR